MPSSDPAAPSEPARTVRPSFAPDAPAEEAFVRLARLAAWATGATSAGVALVEGDRAFNTGEANAAFGRRVVAAAATVEVRGDERDAAPGAHLGVPLRDGGRVLGAVWVHDSGPRDWTPADYEALEAVADAVLSALALRQERADRARGVAALERERDFGTQVLNALGQGIAVLAPDGRVEYANPSALRMLAFEADALVGTSLAEHAEGGDGEALKGVLSRAMAGERSGSELCLARGDGEPLFVYLAGAPLHGAAGHPVGALVTVSNMTGRREAERAKREAEERFRRLSEASEEGIVIHDGGVVLDSNRAAAQIFAVAGPDALVGRTFLDLVAPESREATARHLAARDGEPLDLTGLRAGGERFPVQLRERPIQHQGRTVRVVTVRDLTEQHGVERLKNEFVSIVSHELRTPLTSLRGSLGLLASGRLGTEQMQRMLEVATQNTDRLVRLINDILDVERIASGEAVLRIGRASAAELARQAAVEVRGLSAEAAGRMELRADDVAVRADSDRVVQVLVNLLSNALKFSPTGSPVRVTAEESGGEAVFRVSDEGRGIPRDQLETIFERFQQVDASDSRRLGGTGLGLAICRGIVRQHGGRIWVESAPGEGSTFLFTLPLAE